MHRLKTKPRNGRILEALRFAPEDQGGGDGGGGQGGGTGGTDGGAGAGGGDGKGDDKQVTFTQADLNRVGAKQKAEGKAAAEAAIAKELGVDIPTAKALIAAAKEAEDSKKSEADRVLEQAAAEKKAAEDLKAETARELHAGRLERAFAAQGVDLGGDKDEDKARAQRLLRMVTVEVGASYDDVVEDVKQIKKDFPGLFAAGDGKGKAGGYRAPGSDPKGKQPAGGAGEDKFSSGAERAKARYASRNSNA